jgi:hypothetical protein
VTSILEDLAVRESTAIPYWGKRRSSEPLRARSALRQTFMRTDGGQARKAIREQAELVVYQRPALVDQTIRPGA